MQKYKICPTCKTKNDISNFLCDTCLADISSIKEYEEQPVGSVSTDHLKLTNKKLNINLEIKNGDIVGRDNIGSKNISEFKTISRMHAKFFIKDGDWFIEDLDSTNGTYLDGKKIEKSKLLNNQKLSLSQSFKVKVDIK